MTARTPQGKEAPNTVCWGDRNRKALIRLPLVAKTSSGKLVAPATVEFRLGDGSAHPHLLMAGLAQAMRYGCTLMDTAIILEATNANLLEGRTAATAAPVPKNFKEVAAELERHRGALSSGGVFPTIVVDALIQAYSNM